MDPQEIGLHTTTTAAGVRLKRKRGEIVDSQSEGEGLGSDEEFGWTRDDDPISGDEFTA